MRAIGVLDGLEVVDPETGETRWVQASGGLQFSMADPSNPAARLRGRLGIRNGGMVVFEKTGTMEGVSLTHGVRQADVVAASQQLPNSDEAEAELRAQAAARAPRRRQSVPVAP